MEIKKNNNWQYLVKQYLANSISREELDQLLQKVEMGEDADSLTALMKDYWNEAKEEGTDTTDAWDTKFKALMKELKETAPVVSSTSKNRYRLMYRVAAAAFVILLGAGSYFLFVNNNKGKIATSNTSFKLNKNDILPGITGAILTLSNGKQILLDSAGNGSLAIQGKMNVINQNGQVVYKGDGDTDEALVYNTIITPRGRQYQLVLADGSKVWLNAASSIHFPAAFNGKERKVEITGEAYFEVVHNAEKPFKVLINDMEVEVLGTHFNINSYADEATIQTTLLEGAVKISKAGNISMLKPGQQAQVNKAGKIKLLSAVNLDAVMAWKNGYFYFNHADLKAVMRQISRWYDVDIEYEGKIPDREFGGEISRNANISQVLEILEESKVYFRIENKQIIVQPQALRVQTGN